MFGLGAGELLIILVFALIFIGPKKLPELAKNLGKGLREFQKAKDDLLNEVNNPIKEVQDEIKKEVHDLKSEVESKPVHKEDSTGSIETKAEVVIPKSCDTPSGHKKE